MKLMGTHTYSDLTDCMEKLFGMIDVSHSNKNQDLSKGVKLGWFFMNDKAKQKEYYQRPEVKAKRKLNRTYEKIN